MSGLSPDYKQLYLDAQRAQLEEVERRKHAEHERQLAEDQRQLAEDQRQLAEDQRQLAEDKRHEAEQATRQTTLPEFLDAIHVHLHQTLKVQTDPSQATKGDPSNAEDKLRPERICVWEDFPEQQEQIWKPLADSDFMTRRQFTSTNALEVAGSSISRRKMSSEIDLHIYERIAVEEHVSLILERMHADPQLCRRYNLRGSVDFENHSNTLTPVSEEESMLRLSISDQQRRRSSRLAGKARASEESAGSADRASNVNSSARPRADQFCVYNVASGVNGLDTRTAIFIVEFKAPHKLQLKHIYEGLVEMAVEDVMTVSETDGPKKRCKRLMAAAITQAFSYMVQARLSAYWRGMHFPESPGGGPSHRLLFSVGP